jgi:hypothetical protein
MNRALLVGAILVLGAGCQLPPERAPLQPLPENSQPLPYAELLTRARLQATAATEAFYVNRWTDLEEVARNLEQTGRFLGKATEVPAKHKDKLATEAEALTKEASQLREAAKAQDATKVNAIMQRVNLKIRDLRPES